MNDRSNLAPVTLSIAAVERDTGLSKDTLRVWERRYGFPSPLRDATGERAYTIDQVEKLRVLKRLLEAGHRPGRVVPLPFVDLQRLSESMGDARRESESPSLNAGELQAHLDIIRSHDHGALRHHLTRQLSRCGVGRFITEVVAPLNAAVGEAWLRGQMEIFEEHAYTEVVQAVLRQAIAAIPEPIDAHPPRVVLTTLPGEPHGLGLLMAEAMFALDGCQCVSLGVQTPVWDIALAAKAHRADIVALGFSGCLNPNQVVDSLTELRGKLPEPVRLWAGGSAPVVHRRRIAGVEAFATLQEIAPALTRWREDRG